MEMPDLEQERASRAWLAAERAATQKWRGEFENLAKAAPALIMGNGLMQTLAFFQSKGKDHHHALNEQIISWLAERFQGTGLIPAGGSRADFSTIMKTLYRAEPAVYRQATEEALALLKWIRQFASAVNSA
jgi:CRISPR-associated protein Cmr5